MLVIDALGYAAGSCLVAMSAMKTQKLMRICHIGGNILFVAYGLLADALPVAVMNMVILCLHAYRLVTGSYSR